MRIKVTSNLDDLAGDMTAIVPKAKAEMRKTVVDGIRAGNELAKGYAKVSSRAHAKKYPATFRTEMTVGRGLFGNVYAGEYGPVAEGQGKLAPILEHGSKNNPPHHDLAKSADIIAGSFAQEVRGLPNGWFW